MCITQFAHTMKMSCLLQFLSIDPVQREEIMKALNDDANILLKELDPKDPLAVRLREELNLANEYFYKLLQASQKGPGT